MAGLVAAMALVLGCEAREVQPPGDVPPGAATDPAAERQLIRLTGCLRPDAQPGRFVLASVATAGTTGGGEAEQARSWTAEDETTFADQERAIANSTYQLIPADDQNLAEFVNMRVTVRGLLAPDVPSAAGATATAGEGDTPSTGASKEVASSTTASKVQAQAPPPLRGLHVEEISKVADSCE
jgi:hypothetical protein